MPEAESSPLPLPPPPPPQSPQSLSPSPSPPCLSKSAANSAATIELQPSRRWAGPSRSARLFRRVRAAFRSLPIIAPSSCKFPTSVHGGGGGAVRVHEGAHVHGGTRMTATLFGRRRGRVSLAIQESPRRLPLLVLELALPTEKLLKEMGSGMVRVALECEKQAAGPKRRPELLEEPLWTMYCNGRGAGYAVRREATEEVLGVLKLLHAQSVGAGVLPADESADGELTYLRAHFERVVGSRDSETYHMLNPDGNAGPELSIFFVRI